MVEQKRKPRMSMRLKITLLLMAAILMAILTLWVINKFFLMDYYQHDKINTIEETYAILNTEQMQAIFQEGSAEEYLAIDRICEINNVTVNVYTSDFSTALYITNNRNNNLLMGALKQYVIFGGMEIVDSSDNYIIAKFYESRLNTNYLDLFGYLGSGDVILIRSNMESIMESASISNKFLTYVGIAVTILGAIGMYFISKRFTDPIRRMAEISKRMSELDFNVKYEVDRNDEIGELGETINTLSEKLEKTISELKRANNELESDIQDKIQIDEMRKDFLSNVTHELKTPIALIQGYAEGLKDNINDDEESREFYCDVIIDESMKMNKMVKKLLTLNHIEFGNAPVEMERFELTALINSVLASTNILFQQKGITVHFEAAEELFVWADEYMIEEVLTNYVSNAVNHCAGAKIIEVKLICKETVVRVAVYNTGDQIPEKDLDKVWIKFFKVDKARTREYGGSGIGLSIVKAIMDSHHQECGVVNHGNGVEFWFELDTKAE